LEWDRRLANVISLLTPTLSHRGRGNKTKIFHNNEMKITTKLMFIRCGKNKRGQALVETALVILIILVLLFGIMQLALIGTATIVGQDAAYFVTRAEVVEKDPTMAAIYFMGCFRREDIMLASPSVSSETHSQFNEVVEGKITYFQQILGLFSWLVFNPLRTVTCKMVKSPDEGFYDKSFER